MGQGKYSFPFDARMTKIGWECEPSSRDWEGGRIISRVGHPHRRDAPPVGATPSLSMIENCSKREYDANTTQAPSRLSGPGLEVAKKDAWF